MIKNIIIYLIIFIISISFCFGLEEIHEQLNKNEIFSKIDIEHKNTKKYVSDEITRQREQFLKEVDDRGAYYEREANDMLNTVFWKLGLIWCGVIFFVVGISQIFRLKTERTRFNKLQKYLLEGLVVELSKMARNQGKPKTEVNYSEEVNPEILKDKVQDMIDESAKKEMMTKLDKHYKKEGIVKKDNSLNIGEDIHI